MILVVNNGNRGEIMEKLRGELWEGWAVDGKLKSSLEWSIKSYSPEIRPPARPLLQGR